MRLIFLILLLSLASCQPESGARRTVSGGISSGTQTLEGTWYTDMGEDTVKLVYTETSLRFVSGVVPTTRSIKFMGNNTYYDYKNGEYATYSFNLNTAQVCYDIGCNTLRKNP